MIIKRSHCYHIKRAESVIKQKEEETVDSMDRWGSHDDMASCM